MVFLPLKKLRYTVLFALGLLVVLGMYSLGFFEGMDRYFYDLAFRTRGVITPPGRVVVVAVDEKTLQEAGRWPISRRYYADLLDRLGDARGIGFTIIMSEPSADDPQLARAAARSGKVVFPLYISEGLQLEQPVPPLDLFPSGHIHVILGLNGEASQVSTDIRLGSRVIPSLAAQLYARALPPPASNQDVSPAQPRTLTINYYGPSGTVPTVSLVDVLQQQVPAGFFRDKLVLVGVTAAGIGERVATPFDRNLNRMSGVEAQATILGNMLEGSDIRVVGEWVNIAVCFLLAFALLVGFMAVTDGSASFVAIGLLAGITAMVYLLFSTMQTWVAPTVYYTTTLFAFSATFLFKLADAAARLQHEYAVITAHLSSLQGNAPEAPAAEGLLDYFSLGGINRKISMLSEANCLLLERARQTDEANRELESFSYSVSHDLRAPLRAITGFNDILREDYAHRLDETGYDLLERIARATGRMDTFILSILEMSRLSRSEMKRDEINLAEVARDVASELRLSAPGRTVEFVVPERMMVNADAGLMRVVLENLMGNAWKFTKGRERAVVEMGCEEHNGQQRYFVRDNGVGFDMEDAAKLFAPFKRLHSVDEFPGTGVGLSNVQKIIARHGGIIWANAASGRGATFYFTLS